MSSEYRTNIWYAPAIITKHNYETIEKEYQLYCDHVLPTIIIEREGLSSIIKHNDETIEKQYLYCDHLLPTIIIEREGLSIGVVS